MPPNSISREPARRLFMLVLSRQLDDETRAQVSEWDDAAERGEMDEDELDGWALRLASLIERRCPVCPKPTRMPSSVPHLRQRQSSAVWTSGFM